MGLSHESHLTQFNQQPDAKPLLQLRQLSKHFPIRGGVFQRQIGAVKAVNEINLSVFPNETVTLIGASGAGKTLLARMILQLIKPTAGAILFNGEAFTKMSRATQRMARQQLQMTLQDPYASLNPKMMVSDILAEPLQIHKLVDGRAKTERINQLLQLVGLNPYFAGRYPHEFSGGQRQRISIARALATSPQMLVADDPLLALDPTVQSQIIALLASLKEKFGLALLLLVSDLAHVRQISDRVGILYMGELVELAAADEFYTRPLHPYTQYLHSKTYYASSPLNDRVQPIELTGSAPKPGKLPSGCIFRSQCPYATDVCQDEVPTLRDLGKPGQPHLVSCHHAERFQN